MDSANIEWMKVSDLSFDLENPRLPEFDLSKDTTDVDVISVLWQAMDVRELVMSIAASGFFRHEPLIVVQESGKNVVIEGNRRLAAVRILLDPTLAETLQVSIPAIAREEKEALKLLPTVIGTREGAWRYLGFKHVNGPAKWSSYAKSRYIAHVHRDFKINLEDIAKQIGDTHKTVQRLFRGLMVLERAERWKVFSRKDRWRNHFAFSHLYTGIDYPGIGTFIGLRPAIEENRKPVPQEKKEELRQLFLWLYGSKKTETSPVIERQNPHLRQLNAVVSDREALAALRGGRSLTIAYEISRPSENVFEEYLVAAKQDLQKARGLLSTGYDGSEELLRIADTVADLAYDLYREMERKRSPRRRGRIAEPD